MRSFLKWLNKISGDALARDEFNHNWIGVKNEFHAVHGAIHTAVDSAVEAAVLTLKDHINTEVSEQFKTAGPLIVQKVVEIVSSRISDHGVVFRDILVDRNDDLKESLFRREALLDNSIGTVGRQITLFEQKLIGAMHRNEEKSMRRQNVLIRSMEEMTRQASIHDVGNSERFLQTLERLAQVERKMKVYTDITDDRYEQMTASLDTLERAIGGFTEMVQARRPARKPHFDAAPTLPWLIDNMEQLIKTCQIMDHFQRTDAPRDVTIYHAVEALRKLNLWSAHDVRDELQGWIVRCDAELERSFDMAA